MIIPTVKKLRERDKRDYYPTPVEFCDKAVSLLREQTNYPEEQDVCIMDTGAGTGNWGGAVKHYYPNSYLEGVEIDPKLKKPENYNYWTCEDYLEYNSLLSFDIILGNPPFKYIHEFIDKSLILLMDGGYLLYLGRLALLESAKRYKRYYSVGLNPKVIYVSVQRISWIGDNRTDDTAYALYLWKKGFQGETTLRWFTWR